MVGVRVRVEGLICRSEPSRERVKVRGRSHIT